MDKMKETIVQWKKRTVNADILVLPEKFQKQIYTLYIFSRFSSRKATTCFGVMHGYS
jgi:hypothetical protein